MIVLVSGPPGAGKTTLARELAPMLNLPLVAKDDIKETLSDTLGKASLRWSKRLGAASMEILFTQMKRFAQAGASAIFEANFYPAMQRERIRALRVTTFEVHCFAEPTVLARRRDERDRHRVHHRIPIVWDRNGPLELDENIVRVDTGASDPVDLSDIIRRIREAAGWTSIS